MKLLPLSAILLLSACASNPVPPLVESAPSTVVKVIVKVPCISLEEIPPVPKTEMRAGGDVMNNAAGAAADVKALAAYADIVDALLRSCASTPEKAPDGPANK